MNILYLGDIVGRPGREAFAALIGQIKSENNIDLVCVNGENATNGSGISAKSAKELFGAGVEAMTLGDHTWDKKDIIPFMKDEHRLVRPANYPQGAPGRGYTIITTGHDVKVAVVNLIGRIFIKTPTDCPFRTFDKIYEEIRPQTSNIVVDFHAETTSEKVAFGWHVDGRASAVVGTHTHIQTADEKILPKGTAYITDLGMSGPYDSVIGQNKELIVDRFLTSLPKKFEVATNDVILNGVIIDMDENTGRARGIERLQCSYK